MGKKLGTPSLQWRALGLKAGGALLGIKFVGFPRLVSKCGLFTNSNSRLVIHCKFSWRGSFGNARWPTPHVTQGATGPQKEKCSQHVTNIILGMSCPMGSNTPNNIQVGLQTYILCVSTQYLGAWSCLEKLLKMDST